MAIQALSLPLPDGLAVEPSPDRLDPEAAIGKQPRGLRQIKNLTPTDVAECR